MRLLLLTAIAWRVALPLAPLRGGSPRSLGVPRRPVRIVATAPRQIPALAAAEASGASEKDTMGAAASATSFAGRSALILPFVTATAALARCGASLPVAASPVLLLVHKFLKASEGETLVERFAKVFALASIWVGWSVTVVNLPLACLGGGRVTSYHALSVYLPLLVIAFKRNRETKYRQPFRALLRLLFDLPLVACARLLAAVGIRLFTPFASVIDDEIVQGTIPFAADVATLAAPPYDVCAVVNMCAEWPGPTATYDAHGIAQCRLPFQDTTAPSEDALRVGAKFIADQLQRHPGKRVYVHCKGGIARASTMALAHYILNKGQKADDAVELLKARRHVVMRNAADYSSVRALERSQTA